MLRMLEKVDGQNLGAQARQMYNTLLKSARKSSGRKGRLPDLPGETESLAIPLLVSIFGETWEDVEHLSVRVGRYFATSVAARHLVHSVSRAPRD